MNVYERLKVLGVELPAPAEPFALFETAVQIGNLVYLSGQGSYYGEDWIKGKVGKEQTLEKAKRGARYCTLQLLSSLNAYLGDLNRVKRVVKLLGFVNSSPDFTQQPAVIDGASELLIDIFGENGRHSRSAIGVESLPMGITCEIEAIFEIMD